VRLGESRDAWDQAVNDTANLWQSVFWQPLGRSSRGSYMASSRQLVKLGTGRSADWARRFRREMRNLY
jgi:hypothetical protein